MDKKKKTIISFRPQGFEGVTPLAVSERMSSHSFICHLMTSPTQLPFVSPVPFQTSLTRCVHLDEDLFLVWIFPMDRHTVTKVRLGRCAGSYLGFPLVGLAADWTAVLLSSPDESSPFFSPPVFRCGRVHTVRRGGV